jgi:hypothetical protein
LEYIVDAATKIEMKINLTTQIPLAILLFAFVFSAQAKDVSAQQAVVDYAKQEVDKADAQHKANLKEVSEAEKLLEQRKKAFEDQTKVLAEDRKKAELSKQHLQEANTKLNKAQAILDQAWKE